MPKASEMDSMRENFVMSVFRRNRKLMRAAAACCRFWLLLVYSLPSDFLHFETRAPHSRKLSPSLRRKNASNRRFIKRRLLTCSARQTLSSADFRKTSISQVRDSGHTLRSVVSHTLYTQGPADRGAMF